ncbi:MAG: NAD(P)-binding protein [Rhodocyclaceae bacterium]|nr:NAD(P)-binding protein [Rhodocyclaceae bacterium]
MRRRDFLGAAAGAVAFGSTPAKAFFSDTTAATPPLPPGILSGANSQLGHRLRSPKFPPPTQTKRVAVAIVGAGIGGLSAAWKLTRAGCNDFMLLDLEHEPGGNSRSGQNEVSRYPLGAHYLPLPPVEASATRELLAELGVLRGNIHAAHPSYDEKYLCHAPQERLFIDGFWQEGLWPAHGRASVERAQISRFQQHISTLRARRDASGRRAFALPLALSSADASLRALDKMTFSDWLKQQDYSAAGLQWMCDYACRDDFGTSAAQTSAWAGLHYFSSRDSEGQVLTAPEGNAWLTQGLARTAVAQTQTDALVYHVEQNAKEIVCDVFLGKENRSIRVIAKELIWAAPLFLIPHVFQSPPAAWLAASKSIAYAPWVVANLTLSEPLLRSTGSSLAWDNVLYDSPSLGYVVATHQQLRYAPAPTVITWYRALHEESAFSHKSTASHQHQLAKSPSKLLQSREVWAEEILSDLSRPHPEIRELVTRLDVHRYGHAMIRPLPGWLWGGARTVFERGHIVGKSAIHFAHADVSGMSLFEEANYRGVLAAQRVLKRLGVSFSRSL